MNNTLTLLLAFIAGLALGTLFFGGLWWTVCKAMSSSQPALWFFASLLLRTSITLAGFYVVFGGQGDRLLACLIGFVIARFIVMRITRPAVPLHSTTAKEPSHAS